MENFGIESKSKWGFENDDMHVVITIESITIMSLILTFQLELVPCFSTWIPLDNSEVLFRVEDLLPSLPSSLV
jgi:hypothetical protein